MKEVNQHAGPCYYCNRTVRKGDGYMSLESHALWHDECVGSGMRDGAHHYRTTFGAKAFFSQAWNATRSDITNTCDGWDDDMGLDEEYENQFDHDFQAVHEKCKRPITMKMFTHVIDEHATLTNEQLNQLKTKRSPMSNGNRNTNALLHESGEVSCFVIWCPGSNLPVSQTFDTLEDAWKVADEMARKHDGSKFIVAQTLGVSCIEKPITRRTAMTVGVATKLPVVKRAVKK